MEYSQLGQDNWVIKKTKGKKNGFFIDFGAYDGILHSNTAKLEFEYGWNGICCEPNQKKWQELVNNRQCICLNYAVYNTNYEKISLCITPKNEELSGIQNTFQNDQHQNTRSVYNIEICTTITLTELCKRNPIVPKEIDYLNIDTEGSELDILKAHNFNDYWFKYITVEHNYVEEYRNNIKELLINKGYKLDTSVDSKWDDWYELC